MNQSIINFEDIEEEIRNDRVSDEAVEAAAGKLEGPARSMTASFCSGLDSCPS
jgi:hypothetical protein